MTPLGLGEVQLACKNCTEVLEEACEHGFGILLFCNRTPVALCVLSGIFSVSALSLILVRCFSRFGALRFRQIARQVCSTLLARDTVLLSSFAAEDFCLPPFFCAFLQSLHQPRRQHTPVSPIRQRLGSRLEPVEVKHLNSHCFQSPRHHDEGHLRLCVHWPRPAFHRVQFTDLVLSFRPSTCSLPSGQALLQQCAVTTRAGNRLCSTMFSTSVLALQHGESPSVRGSSR